jgi:hypothetical protein
MALAFIAQRKEIGRRGQKARSYLPLAFGLRGHLARDAFLLRGIATTVESKRARRFLQLRCSNSRPSWECDWRTTLRHRKVHFANGQMPTAPAKPVHFGCKLFE